MNSKNAHKWKDAINKELQNLYGNNVMKNVENKNIPKDIKLLDIKWVLLLKIMVYIKQDWSSEVFDKLKVLIYTCTYSPIIEMNSFRLTIAIALIYKWVLKQTDIKASFFEC